MEHTARVCTVCRKCKALTEFNNDTKGRFGKQAQCRQCHNKKHRDYNRQNSEKVHTQKAAYYAKDLSRKQEEYRRYAERYPWLRTLRGIKSRCTDPANISYKSYGGKGIKNFLTGEDLKFLWFRDRAYEMKRPSIDRLDINKHYTLGNCRYLEWLVNIGNGSRARKGKTRKGRK